jgi:integrase
MAPAPRKSADRALLRDRPARAGAVKRAAVLSADQISTMLAAASPRDAALVALMTVGAMRVGETTLLTWEDIEGCTVELPGGITKTGAGRRFTWGSKWKCSSTRPRARSPQRAARKPVTE